MGLYPRELKTGGGSLKWDFTVCLVTNLRLRELVSRQFVSSSIIIKKSYIVNDL